MKQIFTKTWLMLVALIIGVGSAWAETYKLEQVTSVSAGEKYVFVQDTHAFGSTVSSSALQTVTGYKTTELAGTEAYVWTLETATNGFYIKNVSLTSNQYLNNSSGTNVSFGNKASIWKFDFTDVNAVLIQNTSNNNRFLGYTTATSYAYKAYATGNIDTYAHNIKVFKLVSESDPAAPTLSSIAVSGTPTKTTYFDGDVFDPTGLTVTGTYSDESKKEITSDIKWEVTPSTLSTSTTSVSVVASVGEINSAAYTVSGLTVNAIPEKTIAEFIAAEGGKCYLTGIVSNIKNATFGNFDLTDASGTIYIYGCLTSTGEAQKFNTLGVVEGDKIKVLADAYELYQGTTEAKNVIFVQEFEVEKAKYTVTIDTPTNGTLVVKEGETILASGDEVEEGKTLTVTCTPTSDDYRYKNWQYKEDGDWVTMTTTMTRVVTKNISIRANFETIPVYTIAWSVNGQDVKSEDLKEGATVTAPEVDAINDKVFVGWATTATVDAANPVMVTPMTTATEAKTYYAVFATEDNSKPVTYTKVTNNDFDTTAEYVLAAEESSTESTLHYFSLYTTTTANESWGVTSTDVNDAITFTLSGTADALKAKDSDGNYIQGLSTGKFKMSSSETTLTYKNDGTIYNSSNTYNLRYNHNGGNGGFRWYSTTTGRSAYFYKKDGGPTYSDYTTTVATTPTYTSKSLTLAAHCPNGYYDTYYATFSSDKDVFVPYMAADASYMSNVYTVGVNSDELTMASLESTYSEEVEIDGETVSGYYVPANTGVLVTAGFMTEGATDITYYEVENVTVPEMTEDNMLYPASKAKEELDGCKFYLLAYGDADLTPATLGFYWGAEDGAAFTSREGSAYLAVPAGAPLAKAYTFVGGDATGINNVATAVASDKAYNMAGQRVNANAKGIVVVNGKKMLNK